MSHALTRKCAHFFVKLTESGLNSLTTSEKETGFCLLISLLCMFFNSLERTPIKKHYSKQAESAPLNNSNGNFASYESSQKKPKDPYCLQKESSPSKQPTMAAKTDKNNSSLLTLKPIADYHAMFSTPNRYTKSGLTELTTSQIKSEDEQKLKKQERIKHQSFGFF